MVTPKFHRSSLPRLLPSFALAVLVATTGCSVATIGPIDPSTSTSEPIAAGSTTSVTFNTDRTVHQVVSSDARIVTVGADGGNGAEITAGAPGTAQLTAYADDGTMLDQRTFNVAATKKIVFDVAETAASYAILTGQSYAVHATTIAADGSTLVGDGAVHFAYQGAVSQASGGGLCLGDCGYFTAGAAGDGKIVMTATSSSAKATFAVHAVDKVDSFTLSPATVDVDTKSAVSVGYTVTAAGQPVWATPDCGVVDSSTVVLLPDPTSASGTTGGLRIAGIAAGTLKLTCTVGGKSQTLVIRVHE